MSRARDIADLSSVSARLDTLGATEGALSNKNVVINGGFQIFQRATAATTQTDNTIKTADRWIGFVSGGGAYTTQRSTGHLADTGHDTAWKIDVTTADTSIAAGDYYSVTQRLEAQHLQHFQYGTAAAKTLSLSFWVRATKTGTSCCFLTKNDSTQYNYVAEFTINASDTWEHKTITIEPNSNIKSASGAIANDSGNGMQLGFILAYGSNYTAGVNNSWNDSQDFATTNQVNHMDSTSNDFYITGVQLEVGGATDFEYRTFVDELKRCQRYFCRTYQYGTGTGTATSNGCISTSLSAAQAYASAGNWDLPTTMRTAPTVTVYSTATGTSGKLAADGTDGTGNATFVSQDRCFFYRANDSTGTAANVFLRAHATASAEL